VLNPAYLLAIISEVSSTSGSNDAILRQCANAATAAAAGDSQSFCGHPEKVQITEYLGKTVLKDECFVFERSVSDQE